LDERPARSIRAAKSSAVNGAGTSVVLMGRV
jgi:hypothetical protein